jgi:nucleoside-diphosphate-sugar epimerase
MRVVVTGASGNVGTSVVETVVGLSRRAHDWHPPKTEWVHADVAEGDLTEALHGADAVIHLAWLFQPTRRPEVTWRSNVLGTRRLLDAVVAAGTPAVVVASSVGAYSPRQHTRPVDESWPTHGVPVTAYSREKAYVERMLDALEAAHPECRVVRMRPAFIFQPRASTEQRRLFLGPLVPHAAVRVGPPVLPLPRDLLLQAVHAEDVAEAFTAAAVRDVRGAFNLAADPVLGPRELAGLVGARWLPAPARAVRSALALAYATHAVPASPQLFDLVMSMPVMSPARARAELGWTARHSSADALRAFLGGLAQHSDVETPPLAEGTSGPARAHELATGVGTRP